MNPIYKTLLSMLSILSVILIIISFFTNANIQNKLNIAGYSIYGTTIILILVILIINFGQKLSNIYDIIPFLLILIYILVKLYLIITHQDKISLMNVSKDYYIFLFISICITIFQVFILTNNYNFEMIFENLSEIKRAILNLTSVINIICMVFIYSILSLNITDG